MLSSDCRGLERDRQGQSEPKKEGESRGAGPDLCHLGRASSLPMCRPVPFNSPAAGSWHFLFHQESKHSMFIEKIEKAFFFPSSIKSAEYFF